MEAAARKLVEHGARAVVVKGGHMDRAVDVLFDGASVLILGGDHVKTENTHGSGTSSLPPSPRYWPPDGCYTRRWCWRKLYVTKAIENGLTIGKGPGPLGIIPHPPRTACARHARSPAARPAPGG